MIHIYNKTKQSYIKSQCLECYANSLYNNLFSIAQLLFKSIFHKQEIEINIIILITTHGYDPDIKSLTCCNQVINCCNTYEYMDAKLQINQYEMTAIMSIADMLIVCGKCHREKHEQPGDFSTCNLFHQDPNTIKCEL